MVRVEKEEVVEEEVEVHMRWGSSAGTGAASDEPSGPASHKQPGDRRTSLERLPTVPAGRSGNLGNKAEADLKRSSRYCDGGWCWSIS